MKQIHDLVSRHLKELDKENLFTQITVLSKSLTLMVATHKTQDKIFTELEMEDIWVPCSCCDSPILWNVNVCPYCESKVEDVEEKPVVETKETPVEKVKKKKASKKVSKKASKKADPVIEEVKPEEPEEEVEEDSDDSFPSEEEINKMRRPGLLKVIEDDDLDVDPDEYENAKELRRAVNEAIKSVTDDETNEEEETEETKETTEEATDKELEEFNLDEYNEDDKDDEDDEVFED